MTPPDRLLSRWLRHGAEGLDMDAAGFVPIATVLARLGIDRPALDALVAANNKQRLQIVGDRIRCCQGHSLAGMPVTREALEASWAPFTGAGPVWHGTSLDALPGIDAAGLLPQRRTHVHLAAALESRVGKRAHVAVMLAVDPAALAARGLGLWVAPNGVLLAREVPRACITGARAMTRRAEGDAALAPFGPA
ncbi:MAG: RNA 2'-phosphotransferase [Myxococcales bacterium]|nr:RNA 2'-phosphotransferase [Myxococcales bacterium]